MENETESIFAKIIRGDIPCYKIYEDDNTLAFLDIHPVSSGHTLVVSKTEAPYVWDLNPMDYQNLMESVKKIADRLKEVLNPDYISEMVVGYDVKHAHVHLIPFSSPLDLQRLFDTHKPETNDEELTQLADRLKF